MKGKPYKLIHPPSLVVGLVNHLKLAGFCWRININYICINNMNPPARAWISNIYIYWLCMSLVIQRGRKSGAWFLDRTEFHRSQPVQLSLHLDLTGFVAPCYPVTCYYTTLSLTDNALCYRFILHYRLLCLLQNILFFFFWKWFSWKVHFYNYFEKHFLVFLYVMKNNLLIFIFLKLIIRIDT